MAEIVVIAGLTVVDASPKPLGSACLDFLVDAVDGEAQLDSAQVRELRDGLTEWLQQIGRNT